MADPIKPLNRDKPFKRINNETFLVKTAPDGLGVACGCHTDSDFGDLDKKFQEFFKDNTPLLGPVLKAVEKIRDLMNPDTLAKLLLDAIRADIGPELAAVLGLLLKAAGTALKLLLKPVTSIVDAVLDAVKTALNTFAAVLNRRVLHRALRVIPQWAPVKQGASNKSVGPDQIIEVEGICTRSFGNPIDVPFFNWHTWFDWNVQVTPEPDYKNVLAPVSDPPNKKGATGSERAITKDGSFEIQWDAGALQDAAGRTAFVTAFPDTQMPDHDGPMLSQGPSPDGLLSISNGPFIWPMAGMFVWASGRHVYDCSRVDDAKSDNPKMCAMINPARALATARWVAADFQENGGFSVPAIEFMFVASKRGGYINHDDLADTDYQFIVDLPPADLDLSPYPIGHTDDFPHNTITLRPRLLKLLRFLPRIDSAQAEPTVEVIRPTDPSKAPSQVKVTIPKAALSGVEAYGFNLALGWFDPAHEQARKVKLCTVTVNSIQMRLTDRDAPAKKLREIFKQEENGLKAIIKQKLEDITIADIPIIGKIQPFKIPGIGKLAEDAVAAALDAFIDLLVGMVPSEVEEEWLLRMGVNGVWIAIFRPPRKLQTFTFGAFDIQFKLRLADGDPLLFAAHGTEFDPVGDIMHSGNDHRTIKAHDPKPKVQVPWEKIFKSDSDNERRDLVFDFCLAEMFDATEGVGKLSLGFDNSPLGLIDPDPANSGFNTINNPMVMRDPVDSVPVQRTAPFARADSDQMILLEDPGKPDYRIQYTLEITKQIADDAT